MHVVIKWVDTSAGGLLVPGVIVDY
jgi:hypothetical protein